MAVVGAACAPNAAGSFLHFFIYFILFFIIIFWKGGAEPGRQPCWQSPGGTAQPGHSNSLHPCSGSPSPSSLESSLALICLPGMRFKSCPSSFLRAVFDIVKVEATGALFDPGAAVDSALLCPVLFKAHDYHFWNVICECYSITLSAFPSVKCHASSSKNTTAWQ